MPSSNEVSGIAALSICESLMLALNDRKVLSEVQVLAVLADAAAAHAGVPGTDVQIAQHLAVAELIQKIIDGGNSVRRR